MIACFTRGAPVKKTIRMVCENPIKWSIVVAVSAYFYWEIYQEMKLVFPWYLAVLSYVFGLIFGLVIVAEIGEPISKHIDAMMERLRNKLIS